MQNTYSQGGLSLVASLVFPWPETQNLMMRRYVKRNNSLNSQPLVETLNLATAPNLSWSTS